MLANFLTSLYFRCDSSSYGIFSTGVGTASFRSVHDDMEGLVNVIPLGTGLPT
jgi:hypothetical protein